MVSRLNTAALTQVNDALSDSPAETLDFSMRQEVDKILKIGARIAVCMSKRVRPHVSTSILYIYRCRGVDMHQESISFPLDVSEQQLYMHLLLSVLRTAGCTGTSGC